MSRTEIVALIAMMFATIAFSIDAMLPALPDIGATLSPDQVNKAQLVVTSFVLGMGLGTFFTGPLSDSFGRKPVVLAGAALYILAALMAVVVQNLELLLVARLLQGLGAAGPRVVALAILRDLFSGREMARIMSFVFMIFTLVPAIAPTLGAAIIALSDWHGIFLAFVLFALVFCLWTAVRLPETLSAENRRPFRASVIWAAIKELFSNRIVLLSMMVQSLGFGILFATISTVQPIYDITFDRADSFPFWFGAVALVAGTSSLLNAALVVRLGMRRMVRFALSFGLSISVLFIAAWLWGVSRETAFGLFVLWQTTIFFQTGMTMGNLNAIALEPMGHIAGIAASTIGAVSTVVAVLLAAPIGLAFNGTPLPLILGVAVQSILALALMRAMGNDPLQ